MRKPFALLLFASAFAVACGDSDSGSTAVGPTATLEADEIVVDVERDVRDNLALHYKDSAAKAPVRGPIVQVDFRETSRTAHDGEGVVTGDFIFYANSDLVRRGQIAIHYRQSVDRWLRTGHFDVADGEPVDSHVFAVTVRDARTGRPLPGAEVEVRRLDAEPTSAIDKTDDQGQVRLEVLAGAFQVRVSREDYRSVTTDRIVTVNAVEDLSNIQLVSLKSPVKVL